MSGSGETSAFFSLPYEMPNEINCATLQVKIVEASAITASFLDMRTLCSRFGEIASVLEQDGDDLQTTQFLVEFNDARDVASAIDGLSGAILPGGQMVAVVRSHPPTLDTAKVQAFLASASKYSDEPIRGKAGNRPKSYSESTTFLTSPSSTSSSPPLHSSMFEATAVNNYPARNNRESELIGADQFAQSGAPGSRSSSPFRSGLAATATPWRSREAARPRSSSAFASLSSSSSTLLDDPFSAALSSGYSAYNSTYRSSSALPTHAQKAQAIMPQQTNRLGPIRSDSDPGFRFSYASSVTSSTSSIGRNDQGTGEFSLSLDKVISGEDKRTTLMIRNIPNKYTQQMLLAEINVHHHSKYDFFYLPIDFKNKCNMGYAFINFIDAESIVSFYQEFDAQKWTNFNSEKVCAISYARLQGKQAMITRFQNSSLLDKHESYRPLVFYSSGPNRGKPEPFPSPKPQPHHHNHLHHQQHHAHHVLNKTKPPHPFVGDDYLLAAAHSSRLYAQQQHHQLHHQAHVLHGHALLANAHAAAAAMLHGMPGVGMSTAPLSAPYAAHRSFSYGQGYQHTHTYDRRHGASPYGNQIARMHGNGSAYSYGPGYPHSSSAA